MRREILSRLPPRCTTYCEPFVGAGWVFLGYAGAQKYVIGDLDPEVTSMWEVLRNMPLDEFLSKGFDLARSDERFYANKDKYKSKQWDSPAELLYLYRYLQYYGVLGDYETPIAEACSVKKKPSLPMKEYELVHTALVRKNPEIWNRDYRYLMKANNEDGTLFYLDPPWKDNICQDRYGHYGVDFGELFELVRSMRGYVVVTCNPAALEGLDMNGLDISEREQKYGSCNFVKNAGGRKVSGSSVCIVVKT